MEVLNFIVLHDLRVRAKKKVGCDVGGKKEVRVQRKDLKKIHFTEMGSSDWATCLSLVAAAENGFDWRKWIHQLLDFHTVPEDHCCVTG